MRDLNRTEPDRVETILSIVVGVLLAIAMNFRLWS
jgi:hypothetical protein